MPKRVFIDVNESSPEVAKLIREVVLFIEWWIKTKKTCVPKREIINEMIPKGKTKLQVDHAINILIARKYIRKGITNKMSYVQIGTIQTLDIYKQ